MPIINRRKFLEVGIGLGAAAAWARPCRAPEQFQRSEFSCWSGQRYVARVARSQAAPEWASLIPKSAT